MADSAEMMENKLLKRFTGAACYKSTFQKECMTKYKTFPQVHGDLRAFYCIVCKKEVRVKLI